MCMGGSFESFPTASAIITRAELLISVRDLPYLLLFVPPLSPSRKDLPGALHTLQPAVSPLFFVLSHLPHTVDAVLLLYSWISSFPAGIAYHHLFSGEPDSGISKLPTLFLREELSYRLLPASGIEAEIPQPHGEELERRARPLAPAPGARGPGAGRDFVAARPCIQALVGASHLLGHVS